MSDREARAATRPRQPAPLLLVEDDDLLRSVLLRALQKMGVDPIWAAASTEEARHLIGGQPPIMVLADWNFPGESGVALVRWLRQQSDGAFGKCVPIVLMSGSITNRERLEALDAGADAVLEKPFRLSELNSIIKRLTAQTR